MCFTIIWWLLYPARRRRYLWFWSLLFCHVNEVFENHIRPAYLAYIVEFHRCWTYCDALMGKLSQWLHFIWYQLVANGYMRCMRTSGFLCWCGNLMKYFSAVCWTERGSSWFVLPTTIDSNNNCNIYKLGYFYTILNVL